MSYLDVFDTKCTTFADELIINIKEATMLYRAIVRVGGGGGGGGGGAGID